MQPILFFLSDLHFSTHKQSESAATDKCISVECAKFFHRKRAQLFSVAHHLIAFTTSIYLSIRKKDLLFYVCLHVILKKKIKEIFESTIKNVIFKEERWRGKSTSWNDFKQAFRIFVPPPPKKIYLPNFQCFLFSCNDFGKVWSQFYSYIINIFSVVQVHSRRIYIIVQLFLQKNTKSDVFVNFEI